MKNEKLYLTFNILLIFIYTMHIVSPVISSIYNNKIYYISIFILYIWLLIQLVKKDIDLTTSNIILYFIPFLISTTLISVYTLSFECIKYFTYVFILFFYINKYMNNEKYYIIYLNLVTYSFLLMLFMYILVLINKNLSNEYFFEHLNYLPFLPNSIFENRGHDISLIYYTLVYLNTPDPDSMSIFNVTRFYGFSYEPTIYASLIFPNVFISVYFKRYYHTVILSLSLLLISSYSVFSIIIFLFILYIIQLKIKLDYILIIGIIGIIFCFHFSPFDYLTENYSARFIMYSLLYEEMKYDLLSIVTMNTILDTLHVLKLFGFIIIIYILIHYSLKSKNKLLLIFFIISNVILFAKSGEPFSPLLTWYISFVFFVLSKEKILIFSKNNANL